MPLLSLAQDPNCISPHSVIKIWTENLFPQTEPPRTGALEVRNPSIGKELDVTTQFDFLPQRGILNRTLSEVEVTRFNSRKITLEISYY